MNHQNIYNVAYSEELTVKNRLKLFVEKIDKCFLTSEGGCLFGNLTLEVSSENIKFKEILKEYFKDWNNALVNILKINIL